MTKSPSCYKSTSMNFLYTTSSYCWSRCHFPSYSRLRKQQRPALHCWNILQRLGIQSLKANCWQNGGGRRLPTQTMLLQRQWPTLQHSHPRPRRSIADCKVSIKQIETIAKSGIAVAETVTHSPPSASSSQGARLIEILHSADDVLRKATQTFNKILTSPILK